ERDGTIKPTAGTLLRFAPSSGPGVRVDTYGYEGYSTNPAFDPLLAKLIVHAPDFRLAIARARRALAEFTIEGVATNIGFLHALLESDVVSAGRATTRFVEEETPRLVEAAEQWVPRFEQRIPGERSTVVAAATSGSAPPGTVAVAAPMLGKIVSIDVKVGD